MSLDWFVPNQLGLKPPILLPEQIYGPPLCEGRKSTFQEIGAACLDGLEGVLQDLLRVILAVRGYPTPSERRQQWGCGLCERLECQGYETLVVGCKGLGAEMHQGLTTAAGTGLSRGPEAVASLLIGQRVEEGQLRLHFRWPSSSLEGWHIDSRFIH